MDRRPRTLTPADLDSMLAINQANVPEVGSVDGERMAFLLAESSIALGVDVERPGGAELVGFCLVLPAGSTYDSLNYRWFMERDERVMYLDRVAIAAGFRRQGLGTALYREVLRRIEDEHPEAVALALEVNVDPPNDPSLAFHDRLGFVEVGRQAHHDLVVAMMQRPT